MKTFFLPIISAFFSMIATMPIVVNGDEPSSGLLLRGTAANQEADVEQANAQPEEYYNSLLIEKSRDLSAVNDDGQERRKLPQYTETTVCSPSKFHMEWGWFCKGPFGIDLWCDKSVVTQYQCCDVNQSPMCWEVAA